jgi:hypothetical protein
MLRKNLSTLLNCTQVDAALSTRNRTKFNMHSLAMHGYLEVIKTSYLFMNSKDEITIVRNAVEYFQDQTLKWLLNNFNITDSMYGDILWLASKCNNLYAVGLIPEEHIATCADWIVRYIVCNSNFTVIEYLCKWIHSAFAYNLPLAIYSERVDVVRLILRQPGVIVTKQSFKTALSIKNAEINCILSDYTPLFRQYAIKKGREHLIDVVKN